MCIRLSQLSEHSSGGIVSHLIQKNISITSLARYGVHLRKDSLNFAQGAPTGWSPYESQLAVRLGRLDLFKYLHWSAWGTNEEQTLKNIP